MSWCHLQFLRQYTEEKSDRYDSIMIDNSIYEEEKVQKIDLQSATKYLFALVPFLFFTHPQY